MKHAFLSRFLNPIVITSLGLFFFYIFWITTRPEQVFWSLDEGGKFIHLQSILQKGRIDSSLIYPAESIDPEHEFVPLYFYNERGNKLYSWWPINLAFVSLPFYRLFGWIGLFFLPAAAGALTACLSGIILHKLGGSDRLSLAAVLITGLATPVTFYSTMFWEHTLCTCFCMASLLLLLHSMEQRSVLYGFSAGILASISIFFRIEALPILAGFGLVLLFRYFEQAVWFALGTILSSLPWLGLNYFTSGHPLGPTFSMVSQTEAFSGLSQVGLKLMPFALFNPPRADAFIFSRPVLALASLLLVIGILTFWFRKTTWISLIAFAGVTTICGWVALQPSQFQAVHGVVLVAPQIIFGVYLFTSKQLWKQNPFSPMLLAALLLLAGIYIRQAWVAAGGLQWGPRYLLNIYPLMTIAALIGIPRLVKTHSRSLGMWAIVIFSCACLVGFIFELRGIFTARKLMNFYARSIPIFAAVRDAPIVLTWEGYAMDVNPLYWQGNVVSLSSEKPDWDLWNKHAHELGLEYYYTVKLLTVDNAPLDQIEKRLQDQPTGVILQKIIVSP